MAINKMYGDRKAHGQTPAGGRKLEECTIRREEQDVEDGA